MMVLEAANTTTLRTSGMIGEVAMTLGKVTFLMVVQVLKSAPFQVLLGQPFFALTSCETRDSPMGEQQLILRDPNSGDLISVPMYDRMAVRKTTTQEGF